VNEAVAVAPRRSWVREWLRYDESRIGISLLLKTHAKLPAHVDYFSGGVFFELSVMVIGAPVVEEFAMQGWLHISKVCR
jgi:hypothetical protein